MLKESAKHEVKAPFSPPLVPPPRQVGMQAQAGGKALLGKPGGKPL